MNRPKSWQQLWDSLDKGKAIFNLEIDIGYQNRLRAELKTQYGDPIEIAQRLIAGKRYVTDKGYLLKGHKKRLETRAGTLDIDETSNAAGLIALDRVLKGEIPPIGEPLLSGGRVLCTGERPPVHFHYEDGGLDYVIAEQGALFLSEIRKNHEFNKLANSLPSYLR